MIEQIIAALGGRNDYSELQALCAQLVKENDALRLENARLRTENRQLRRRLADRELATLRRAEADCLLLGALHYGHVATSRSSALEYGISRRRWMWANGLLQLASVRHRDGHWRNVPLEDFEARLRGAVGFVEREGLPVLAERLPKNGYSGEHKTRPRATSGSHARGNAGSARRD